MIERTRIDKLILAIGAVASSLTLISCGAQDQPSFAGEPARLTREEVIELVDAQCGDAVASSNEDVVQMSTALALGHEKQASHYLEAVVDDLRPMVQEFLRIDGPVEDRSELNKMKHLRRRSMQLLGEMAPAIKDNDTALQARLNAAGTRINGRFAVLAEEYGFKVCGL